MAGYAVAAFFAAVGLLSVLWCLFGWMLPACREGILIYRGVPGQWGFVPLYLWLRNLGLVRCPMLVVAEALEERQRMWLAQREIEVCSLAELPGRLGMGAETT